MTNRRAVARRSILVAVAALVTTSLIAGQSGAGPILAFEPSVKLSAGRGFEPGIDVAPDGTVVVNEPAGLPGESNIWRSTNGGASFSSAITVTSPWGRFPGGGDTDVTTAVGPNGEKRLYLIDLWGGSNSFSRSDDNGATFNFATPLSSNPTTDRAWLETGSINPLTGEQTVYIAYSTLVAPPGLYFNKSIDGGRTWLPHTRLLTAGGAQSGQLVADGDFVGMPYNSGNERHFTFSTDAGDTWKTVEASTFQNATGSIAAAAMDPVTKSIHTVWMDRFTNGIAVGSSYDGGNTWSLSQSIYSGGRSLFPWIAARNSKVAVAWYAADGYHGDPNTALTSTVWDVKYSESTDNGVTYSAPIDAPGTVRKGHICTQGLSCNSGRDLGDFLQVAIDSSGRSLISHGSTVGVSQGGVGAGAFVTRQKVA